MARRAAVLPVGWDREPQGVEEHIAFGEAWRRDFGAAKNRHELQPDPQRVDEVVGGFRECYSCGMIPLDGTTPPVSDYAAFLGRPFDLTESRSLLRPCDRCGKDMQGGHTPSVEEIAATSCAGQVVLCSDCAQAWLKWRYNHE
jgi:hypothetical protein